MYQSHVSIISAAMREDANTFKRGVQFASLSIHSMFVTIPRQFADLDQRGRASKYLWGNKVTTYAYLEDNGPTLHAAVSSCDNIEDALRLMVRVPGMGLTKSAFVLQFLGHDIGCLDTRNIQREGLNYESFNLHGISAGKAFERKLANYLRLAGGRAEILWDTWCTEVAEAYKVAGSPEQVSKLHVDCIVKSKPGHVVPVPSVPYISEDMPW